MLQPEPAAYDQVADRPGFELQLEAVHLRPADILQIAESGLHGVGHTTSKNAFGLLEAARQ